MYVIVGLDLGLNVDLYENLNENLSENLYMIMGVGVNMDMDDE